MPIHGRNTVFKLGTAGSPGTPSDISAFCDSVSVTYDGEELDATTFHPTNTTRAFLSGFSTGSVSISGKWDAGIETHMNGVRGLSGLAFEYGPEGGASGKTKITGSLVFRSYTGPESSVDAVSAFSAEFRISGDVTLGTYT